MPDAPASCRTWPATCSPWGEISPARRSVSFESIPIAGSAEAPKLVCWPVALDTPARQGQAVGFFQSTILRSGGNWTPIPTAFEASNLVRDAAKISLGSQEAASLPALPEPRQSAEVVVDGSGKKSTVYLLGGIGPDGAVRELWATLSGSTPDPSHWTKLAGVIPDSRGMFRAAL